MFKENILNSITRSVASTCQKIQISFAGFSIFLVYFWFGLLKVFDLSPASPMVAELLSKTMPFFPSDKFLVLFGFFEILIGILFLLPRYIKIALIFLLIHLVSTVLPLFMMISSTWSGFLAPTLEGQYIIKNIFIIALAIIIAANLKNKES